LFCRTAEMNPNSEVEEGRASVKGYEEKISTFEINNLRYTFSTSAKLEIHRLTY